jgi:hypothetical protein
LLEGKDLPTKKMNLAKKYFTGKPSRGDGWKLTNYLHQELREVLEVLIPLLIPNKPKRITVQVTSAVVDCLINREKYSWAKIFKERIKNQVVKLQTVRVNYLACGLLPESLSGRWPAHEEGDKGVEIPQIESCERARVYTGSG